MGPPARSPRGRVSTFSTGATRAMPSATSDTRTGAISSPLPCLEYRSLFFLSMPIRPIRKLFIF